MELKNILQGWKNLALKHLNIADPDTEKLAVYRYVKCLQCEYHNKKNLRCGKCGCHMPAKVRAKSAVCPIGRW